MIKKSCLELVCLKVKRLSKIYAVTFKFKKEFQIEIRNKKILTFYRKKVLKVSKCFDSFIALKGLTNI